MLPIEWPTDRTLQFIEEYKARPVLWDRDHTHYRIADSKMKAWSEMAAIFDIDVWELKKKMSSLLASYRRVRYKMRNSAGENQVPTWFAFKSFSFLSDKCIAARDDQDDAASTGAIEEQTQDHFIKAEAAEIDNLFFNEDDLTALNGIEQQPEDQPAQRKKRRCCSEDERRSKGETSSTSMGTRRMDEDQMFSEYVTSKMRYFDHRTKCVVQYLVSNILFQADMGHFKDGDLDYEQLIKFNTCKNKEDLHVNDTKDNNK